MVFSIVVGLLRGIDISGTQDISYGGECCMGSTKLIFKAIMLVQLSVAQNGCVIYVGVPEAVSKRDFCVID